MAKGTYTLPRGAFTISIDYEFALGFADSDLHDADKERIRREVDVVNRLLDLFERYNVPATWAITGHLLEEKCSWKGDVPHPEYPRPIRKRERRDWFFTHPPEGEYSDVLWFDTHGLVHRIARSSVGHEIASHSYAHIIYGARGTSKDAVRADIENTKRIHQERRYPLYSFVFPRNREGRHEMLKSAGFTCFRSGGRFARVTGWIARWFRRLFYALPFARTGNIRLHRSGLLEVPASMDMPSREGLRKLMLPTMSYLKARSGLRRAVRRKEMFHLWFHPSNFVLDADTQFDTLERILARAALLRERGELSILTMQGACEQAKMT